MDSLGSPAVPSLLRASSRANLIRGEHPHFPRRHAICPWGVRPSLRHASFTGDITTIGRCDFDG
ncbi:hypothetical protein QJS10_CPA10g01235 [Acorus calamus]|uniref:Uncharacterized protein n=1 Tax=Acorus calamus TaxID=4465 RepID=A0AAV9E3L8_ACOCL|nr:hypothetical protein QJS10_CPA10g01235 [Acorus calamus]